MLLHPDARAPRARHARGGARLVLVGAALLGALACGLGEPPPTWQDQLQADGACYDLDLGDGLSTEDATELRLLLDCLDQRGQLTPLVPVVDALDAPSRAGRPAGGELGVAVEGLAEADLSLWGLLDAARAWLDDDASPIDHLLEVALELSYGLPAATLRDPSTPLRQASVLESAPLGLAALLLPTLATAALDAPDGLDDQVADLLVDRATARLLGTVAAALTSEHPDVAPWAGRVVGDLGAALDAAADASNDRWQEGTGHSLRDAVGVLLLSDDPLLDTLEAPLGALVHDAGTRRALVRSLDRLATDGRLVQVPAQLAWLASVDTDGGSLPNRVAPSALQRLLRALHDANRPMRCSLDLWITNLSVDLGNLSVTLLDVLADLDDETAVSLTAVLSDVLGASLGDALLRAVADSGVCPVFTPRLLDDLGGLDAIAQPAAADLLPAFLEVLRAVRDGGDDHLDDLVDTASLAHAHGSVPVLEELLRDLGPSSLLVDVMAMVPPLARPTAFGLRPQEGSPFTLEELFDVLATLLAAPDPGEPALTLTTLRPLLAGPLDDDALWAALAATAPLLRDPDTATARVDDLLVALLRGDPDLATLDAAARLVRTDAAWRPLARALETPAVPAALLASRPPEGAADPRVPRAWLAELTRDGAVRDLLHLADLLLDLLEELPTLPRPEAPDAR